MRVTGTVTLNIASAEGNTFGGTHAAERLVQAATDAPPGSTVVLQVAPRQHPPIHGIAWLREHGQHLGQVVVECSCPDTIRRWLQVLRGEVAA